MTDVPRAAGPFVVPRQRDRAAPRPSTTDVALRPVSSWSVPSTWRWEQGYVPRVMASDATCALVAAGVAYTFRFGAGATPAEAAVYTVASLTLPALWVFAVALARGYEPRFLGVGSEEFRRVAGAAAGLIAVIGVSAYLLAAELARGYVVLAMPLAALLSLVLRYVNRKHLHRRRARTGASEHIVAVGHVAAVAALVRQVHSAKYHGMRVVAACVPAGLDDPELTSLGVPVRGGLDEAVRVVTQERADGVAVLPCPELDGASLRRLGWGLEQTAAHLYVAPALMEVAGPRISIHPVCGLPLLHLERPELAGIRRLAKASFDRVVAMTALLALLPLFAVVGTAVRLESRGPVLFRQLRVGKDGRLFTMYKLRTMVAGADERVTELKDRDAGNGVLFKVRQDPRVTRLGRFLRRYSIDELPQFINVLRGDMSLVGPRPPLPREVEQYGDDMHRRFLVRPGLTGLWQINGRSDLDWDESVRLDLRYVENWSFAFDCMILWKTAGAVLRGRGAY